MVITERPVGRDSAVNGRKRTESQPVSPNFYVKTEGVMGINNDWLLVHPSGKYGVIGAGNPLYRWGSTAARTLCKAVDKELEEDLNRPKTHSLFSKEEESLWRCIDRGILNGQE